jgi:superfamily II DNA or RNA helicase
MGRSARPFHVESDQALMPTPYSSEDLGRIFDARILTRGRSLVLLGSVKVGLDGDVIVGEVDHLDVRQAVRVMPVPSGRTVSFDRSCTCRVPNCAHQAAVALAALDRFPAFRKAAPKTAPKTAMDSLGSTPGPERQRLVLDLSAGTPPHACFVATSLVGERSGKMVPTTPERVLAHPTISEASKALARALGGGEEARTAISPAMAPSVLEALAKSGQARWQPTGKRLSLGDERSFDANSPPNLPPKSAVILSNLGPWYVDAATGAVGRVRLRRRAAPRAPEMRPRAAPARAEPVTAPEAEQVIVERAMTPLLQLQRINCPDENGRLMLQDALIVDFDYDGVLVRADDDRQFLRVNGPGGANFVRRDSEAEAAAFEALRQDGFVQVRAPDGANARGRRVFVYRGRDAAEQWQGFVTKRVPALTSLGWRSRIDGEFGPRQVERLGVFDMQVQDAASGRFSLDFGIEIDGVRRDLLPILSRLLERGGFEAAQIEGDELITSLDDGRIVRLPAERMRRLLSIMGDLIEAAQRTAEGQLLLEGTEAPNVLELEDLLTTRWQNAAAIEAYAAQFRDGAEIMPVIVPASFTASLRPYQQHGVDWLQHLRSHNLSGFLADDMGLGKTAQTIAHIVVEQAAGRLDRPALIVVPTSLVSNWRAELAKFAPSLRVTVLHGLDRHEKRGRLDGLHVVITTYTVLARDIEEMTQIPWHIVVLDEAQAIKSPDAKATRAVCQLDTRHRLCLSGTPIENNLEELWSQFAFLMPGLLGDRRSFAKRFRTPIEKKGDDLRRLQLVRRIRPFILRRTKSEVATELPPKHTILRRITLGPEQRELYETIRVTLYEKVREQIAVHSLAQSRIVVLDALLKLRQACCDPRLVKLPSARQVESSSKLEDLLEMMTEMLAEGRRILLFSQFTSMLDLIKPRLQEAGIRFAELRGSTRDRGEPVRLFESGEVPVFLISLKAGGRGLNLTSADTVIHYDPWWNPAVEDQASDRAHRIGQTRSVFVYKMIAADTVEERIVALQERKAALARIAFSEDDDLPDMDFDEIEYLFGSSQERIAA